MTSVKLVRKGRDYAFIAKSLFVILMLQSIVLFWALTFPFELETHQDSDLVMVTDVSGGLVGKDGKSEYCVTVKGFPRSIRFFTRQRVSPGDFIYLDVVEDNITSK